MFWGMLGAPSKGSPGLLTVPPVCAMLKTKLLGETLRLGVKSIVGFL